MKQKTSENYLERRPARPTQLRWSQDDGGIVTLEMDNTGFMNRLAQRLFHKPKVSYIHMDDTGSFVWLRIDGQHTIAELAQLVDVEFGEAAHPLYERLAKFFRILDSYHFVDWV